MKSSFEIPGLVVFDSGLGGLTRARITSRGSTAELYFHGAQVTAFQKHGQPPLLFLSAQSRFEPGRAIRGGVPICFPWFGPRVGGPAHGFARITEWELVQVSATADGGGATLRLRLPASAGGRDWPRLQADLVVTVTESLKLELIVTNSSAERELVFEECLHSYFAVGDVRQIEITGLEGMEYTDHIESDATRLSVASPLRLHAQTDRTYFDHPGVLEINDPVLRRVIRIAKNGSASSVIWNPWTTQILADLGSEEYRQMVCVESGNVGRNRITLRPNQSAVLGVELSETSS